ncbi:hypothetical protein BUALT_Bualt03G0112000 [Buddleja alternifolia]|uniref:Uncharacterized protein n=1 Tax=Buddleja alternifolia TaxID=168488 RepID=A0AAV6XV48_9LAMI|nr:hypothetical protein BUALT_Bualt03G0112000 [Buddleja alternifolia]
MEGVGSRQSRASARYGPGPSAAVFNGPVRKWKKQWVSSHSNANNRNDTPPLILCRWTPLSDAADEPPKRRFRYAPIVPIEKGNMEALEKVSDEARTSTMNQSKSGANMGSESDGMFEKPSTGDISPGESQFKPEQNRIPLVTFQLDMLSVCWVNRLVHRFSPFVQYLTIYRICCAYSIDSYLISVTGLRKCEVNFKLLIVQQEPSEDQADSNKSPGYGLS